MAAAEDFDQFQERLDADVQPPPAYLTYPVAERELLLTPDDLAQKADAACPAKGRLVGSISNGVALIPVQRDLRCGRVPGHSGAHLLWVADAGSSELAWFYSWTDEAKESR